MDFSWSICIYDVDFEDKRRSNLASNLSSWYLFEIAKFLSVFYFDLTDPAFEIIDRFKF
jgi:CRISPR/Cas system-associated endoribonuclease Cas2